MNKIGGRKVLFGFLFLAVGVGLALALGDLPSNLMEFMIFLSAGFFLGNGIEHTATAVKDRASGAKNASAELEEVKKHMALIHEQASINAEGVKIAQDAVQQILGKVQR